MSHYPTNVCLDDNGNVSPAIPEQDVEKGDTITYTLIPKHSGNWEFYGYRATNSDCVTVEIEGPHTVVITINKGATGEEVDLTLLYKNELTGFIDGDGDDIEGCILKTNDPVIIFR